MMRTAASEAIRVAVGVVVCSMLLACGGTESGKGAEQLQPGAGGSHSTDADTGGTPASGVGGSIEPSGVGGSIDATASGEAGLGCIEPPAIDPGTWPTCSTADGLPASVPNGTVLAQTDQPVRWAAWLGDQLYLAGFSCGCVGPCPIILEGCAWSVEHVEPCSQTRLPVGSGRTYSLRSAGGGPSGFLFASNSDAAFWVTYGDPVEQYVMDPAAALDAGDGSLYRAAVGSGTATRLRGGDGVVRRTFDHLTAHGDRLYWIESTWECQDVSTYVPDCVIPPGRLVSASASATSLPDSALTVHYESPGAADASTGELSLADVFAMAIDDENAYVLQPDGLHRLPLAGGPPTRVTDCPTGSTGLAIDDTYLYVVAPSQTSDGGQGPNAVVRIAKADGSCQELATTAGADVAVLSDEVYFQDQVGGSCTSALSRVQRTGGPRELVVASGFGGAYMPSEHNGRLLVALYAAGPFGGGGAGSVVELAP